MAHDFMKGCLVDGDSEQLKHARKIRQRALGVSISVQAIALTAILLMPLFAKPAAMPKAIWFPTPLYSHQPQPARIPAHPLRRQRIRPNFSTFTGIPNHINTKPEPPEPPSETIQSNGPESTIPRAIPMVDARVGTQPATPPPPQPKAPGVVHLSRIDASKLVSRIEPSYPVLAKQIGRSGKVELHAIIGEDGMIQSLEAVGGDPMFFSSAMLAVKQWRYTPTMLNGQAVKVDTYITVIYNIAR